MKDNRKPIKSSGKIDAEKARQARHDETQQRVKTKREQQLNASRNPAPSSSLMQVDSPRAAHVPTPPLSPMQPHQPASSSVAMDVDHNGPAHPPSNGLSAMPPTSPHQQQAPTQALSPMQTDSHASAQASAPEQSRFTPQQMDAFLAKQRVERQQALVGRAQPVTRPSPELSNFMYDVGGPKLEHQVKYGPEAAITKANMKTVTEHYGENVGKRYSQYSSNRQHYVDAAKASGRNLTIQEDAIANGKDPGTTSINHVIASGTGQNMMNQMTLQHREGVDVFASATKDEVQAKAMNDNDPKRARASMKEKAKGVAMMAAAVGRMTGVGRAILAEEAPLSQPMPAQLPALGVSALTQAENQHIAKRNSMTSNVVDAFESSTPEHALAGYKGYLKQTFDSFGNLRLGHGTGNGRVSTGFDTPLTSTLQPTARGERLFQALQDYGMPELEQSRKVAKTNEMKSYQPGHFTVAQSGQKLSSSTEK
jgi:hypothetical protein